MYSIRTSKLALFLGLLAAAPFAQALVVYDSLSNAAGYAAVTATSSPVTGIGNQFTGMAINLVGTGRLSDLSVPLGNVTGSNLTGASVRLNVWIWNTVDLNATASTLVFSGQAGTPGGPSFSRDFTGVTLNNNQLDFAELDDLESLGLDLAPTNGSTIGITFNWQIFDGTSYVNRTGLNTTIIGGASTLAPAVGFNAITGVNGSYFRNVNTTLDMAGNFSGASSRQIGANSGIALRLEVSAIPEPASAATLFGVVALGGSALRRKRRAVSLG